MSIGINTYYILFQPTNAISSRSLLYNLAACNEPQLRNMNLLILSPQSAPAWAPSYSPLGG
jgi:hypothetical protein